MTPIVFREEAAADLQEARDWYAERDEGLADDFLGEVERIVGLVAEGPHAFPLVHRTLRRALLHRFPYCVFFELREGSIEVVAVFHAHRDPRGWRSRV